MIAEGGQGWGSLGGWRMKESQKEHIEGWTTGGEAGRRALPIYGSREMRREGG